MRAAGSGEERKGKHQKRGGGTEEALVMLRAELTVLTLRQKRCPVRLLLPEK